MTATTKADVTAQISRLCREFEARFAGLGERDLDRPLFTAEGPGWRVRDLMPHLAFWLRLSARGAQSFASWRERPTADQLAELRSGRDDLLAALAPLPADLILIDDAVTGGIRRYIWQPAINHPREHREHIDTALAKEGAST